MSELLNEILDYTKEKREERVRQIYQTLLDQALYRIVPDFMEDLSNLRTVGVAVEDPGLYRAAEECRQAMILKLTTEGKIRPNELRQRANSLVSDGGKVRIRGLSLK